jgi:hypothetical protein
MHSVKHRIVGLLGLILALGMIVPFVGTNVSVAAQTPADCTGMEPWVAAYHQVGVDYMAAISGLDSSNLENWTDAEFVTAQNALDTAIASVNALTPPAVAAPLQAKAVESLQMIKEMFTTVQTDGLFAALPYIDKVNAASDELDAIAIPLEEQCQIAILDNDDDNTPEIGPGNVISATPGIDPSAALGSYANPIPVGATQATVDGWSIQVVSVTPDGTQQVLDENSFNTAPEQGRQFFIATVTATWTGAGTQSFDGNYRLRVLGANNETYTAFGDACGVTPNEWDEDIVVASGESITGNLCWSVPADELPYLRMFDDESADSGSTVYWSLGQEPAQ